MLYYIKYVALLAQADWSPVVCTKARLRIWKWTTQLARLDVVVL